MHYQKRCWGCWEWLPWPLEVVGGLARTAYGETSAAAAAPGAPKTIAGRARARIQEQHLPNLPLITHEEAGPGLR